MEENQIQVESQKTSLSNLEPISVDNSQVLDNVIIDEQVQSMGESSLKDPVDNLILGKFKTVDDLSKAYSELQRHQGQASEELGALRKELSSMNSLKQSFEQYNNIQNDLLAIINRDKAKYTTPEYFQDPTFREIYREALLTFGTALDTERLINLLDSYANARIYANEKKKVAEKETQKVLDSMGYEAKSKTTFTPPKKRFDEMTEKEIDDLLDRLI